MDLQFYSYNLDGGENTTLPARFYQSFLGGTLLKESFGHSELQLATGQTIVFSKNTEHCPVRPGTITIQCLPETIQNHPQFSSLKLVQKVPEKNYSLYEDSWGNWVWIYFVDSK
ncbi:VOC family protein [Leptospira bandrabouensis]|uniref:VOC family protein n=1 Tax=Leptospira bandrabouensis TaxID=2484903 RepID=UPI001EE7FF24|nr:VOC family protein [Leptospira bandrabouensis]MCG6144753.1 VOC family protein [Leptospira bandrabouensis]MCG6160610.1 VOC family protein [Leptospira bandrabouensis]MCG6164542.1 VOC family protein [Leptospira bandrabouensis]